MKNIILIVLLVEAIWLVTLFTFYFLSPLIGLFVPHAAQLLIVLFGMGALAGYQVAMWRIVRKYWHKI